MIFFGWLHLASRRHGASKLISKYQQWLIAFAIVGKAKRGISRNKFLKDRLQWLLSSSRNQYQLQFITFSMLKTEAFSRYDRLTYWSKNKIAGSFKCIYVYRMVLFEFFPKGPIGKNEVLLKIMFFASGASNRYPYCFYRIKLCILS